MTFFFIALFVLVVIATLIGVFSQIYFSRSLKNKEGKPNLIINKILDDLNSIKERLDKIDADLSNPKNNLQRLRTALDRAVEEEKQQGD